MKFNNETIKVAVNEWIRDDQNAFRKYGNINDWDISEVSDITLFLTPNKGDSMIVFKMKIDIYIKYCMKFGGFSHINGVGGFTKVSNLIKYIDDRNHIINLTNHQKIDLNKNSPVIISVPSQDILESLHYFFPKRKFVIIYRWERLDEDIFFDESLDKWIFSYDEIWITANEKRNDLNLYRDHKGKEVLDFPGSKTMSIYGREWIDELELYNYSYLRVYEEEAFNDLKTRVDFKGHFTDDWDEEYEEAGILKKPFEPSLILEYKKYGQKLIFK